MKTKKILTSLLLTVFVVFTMSVSAFAADNEAKIGATEYPTLAEALAVGGEVTLLKDVSSSSIIKIEKDTVLNLDGFTVTGSAKKVFEVYADATFKNGTIKNTYAGATGRCINTRTGSIELNIEDVSLITNSSAANTQVINIGGDATGMNPVVVNITDSTLTASNSGYGVLIYNPVDMTITNTDISGYAALYFKAADGSAGSKGSAVEIVNSDLSSSYRSKETFGTIVFEDTDIDVTVDADSSITTEGNAVLFSSKEENTTENNNVAINGTVTAGKVVVGWAADATVSSTNANVTEALENQGFVLTEGKVTGTTYTEVADYAALISALAEGGEIKLVSDISSSSIIKIEKDTVLDLNGFTVTGSAKKVFEVYADATFKNGTIKNIHTNKEGRCIDTRTGGITLTLDDITLLANTNGYNQQVINIGGDATGKGAITVNITDSTITASNSGYGMTTFNPVNMTITNTDIYGYATLFFKEASSSMGSAGSVVNVVNSDLNSSYHAGENFGAIVFRDNNINITIDENSTITTEGNAVLFSNREGNTTENNNVAINGTVTAGKVVVGWAADATVSSTNTDVIAALENEGFVVTEGTVADKLGWTAATDAGYYMVDGVKTGLMRYLFHADITKDITEAGILYISTGLFDENDTDANKMGEIKGAPSADNAFYGDIINIPENTTGTYYAVAYVKTADGTFWSGVVECEPNFDTHFSSLDGGVK